MHRESSVSERLAACGGHSKNPERPREQGSSCLQIDLRNEGVEP